MMRLSRRSVWSLAVCVTAVMWGVEVEPRVTSQAATYKVDRDRLWRVATSAPQLGSWFSWASYIRELEPGTPLRPGKQLLLGYQLPIVGDYVFTATVTEVQEGRRVVLEGDNPLQPVLTAEFSSSQQGRSQLSLSVSFHRRSSLFQLQLGLLLRLVAGQQLSQSLLVLQLLIHNNVM